MAFHLLKPKPSPLSLLLLHHHHHHHHLLLPKYLCTQSYDELSIKDSNLLDNLSSLLKSFHQTSNPQTFDNDQNFIPPTLTIPSLSTSLSQLCPTPLPPHIPLHLLRRISSPLHTPSIPFSPALSFFNWWLSTTTTTSTTLSSSAPAESATSISPGTSSPPSNPTKSQPPNPPSSPSSAATPAPTSPTPPSPSSTASPTSPTPKPPTTSPSSSPPSPAPASPSMPNPS